MNDSEIMSYLGTNKTHIRAAYVSYLLGRRAAVDFLVYAGSKEAPVIDGGIWYTKAIFLDWWEEYYGTEQGAPL